MRAFTPAELELLKLSDQAEEQETPAEKNCRWSRESRERRRMRMGDAAWLAFQRELTEAREARRAALKANRKPR